jgi:hypothetical protein
MSPTDNEIHRSTVGDLLQHLKLHNLEDWRRDARLVMMYEISHDKVAVSKSDRLSSPLGHYRSMHSQAYQVSLCITQQSKSSFLSHRCWLEPPTSDHSAQWLDRFPQVCDIITSSNLYIHLRFFVHILKLIFLFVFLLIFHWYNLQTVGVGQLLVEVEVEQSHGNNNLHMPDRLYSLIILYVGHVQVAVTIWLYGYIDTKTLNNGKENK